MQAIETKYISPTNHRGARLKASCQAAKIIVPYDYASDSSDHDVAARALIVKMGWFGTWVRGASADGKGNVYVNLSREIEGRAFKTPHPQSCYYLDLLIVRAP